MSSRTAGRALVIAHRGASAYHWQNSLAAFSAAVALGADGVELDVHDTQDGVLVVHHDPLLDGRPIGTLTAAEVTAHRLPNGEPVPTLAAVLGTVGPKLIAFIELKSLDPAHDDALRAAIGAAPAPANCHIHSFDHRVVFRVSNASPGVVAGVLSTSYPVRPFAQVTEAGARELWQHESMIDGPLVEGAHALGLAVYAWTVDEPGRMRELLALDVDGICTNRPDVARKVVD